MAEGLSGRGRAASISAASIAAIGAFVGCAELLGIPSDPELSGPPVPGLAPTDAEAVSTSEAMVPGGAAAPSAPPSGAAGASGSDGILPAGNVTGVGEVVDPGLAAGQPATAPSVGLDAGIVDAGEPRPVTCDGVVRVPLDVIFIVDNSGSMASEAAAFEQALPAFVERLERGDVDFRIILLSRHRLDEPDASAEASTSVCIPVPVSGLEACPSEKPVLGARFFHYSVKIDAADSLQLALQTFSQPDRFGLTASGWSEWLRAEARQVFIEISDADSDLPASELTSALSAAAPEHFGADPAAPSFVFHSVVGVRQKSLALDIYGPREAIEPRICEGRAATPITPVRCTKSSAA